MKQLLGVRSEVSDLKALLQPLTTFHDLVLKSKKSGSSQSLMIKDYKDVGKDNLLQALVKHVFQSVYAE
jgi:hypothetical protein